MADAVGATRAGAANVWGADVTNTGAQYAGAASVSEMPPIFPKLWRRLETYSRDPDVGNPNALAEFIEFLLFQRDEQVLIIGCDHSIPKPDADWNYIDNSFSIM